MHCAGGFTSRLPAASLGYWGAFPFTTKETRNRSVAGLFVIHPAQAIRLFSPDRRMPAGAHPQTACVHSLGSVESQCFHSRSAGCRQANNRCPIRAPHKMFRPALTSWMIEGNGGIAFRIDPCCVDVFVPVAPRTGQTQIVQRIRAACPSGQDVVNGEDKASQPFGTLAIFAALPRPLTYFVSS